MVQKFFRIFTIFFQSGPPGRFLQILNSNPLISFNDVRQRRNTLSSDFASDSAFNIMKLPDFSGNNKSHGQTGLSRPSRTAYTVHVRFRILGHIKIIYMGYPADIQSSCCHVSSHKNINCAFFKLADDCIAFLLRQVAMKTFCHIPALFQRLRHLVGTAFRPNKDNGQFRILHIQQPAKTIELLHIRQFDIFLFHQVNCNRSRFNLHKHRITKERFRQFSDRCRHGSREKHRLPFFRHPR